jgi:predicted ATPase
MALIEGFRVQNYRALKDITLGRLSNNQNATPLTPFTVVIGKNGVGKSSLFDAFGFLSDCITFDIETACNAKQRGGFDWLRSKDSSGPIQFEVYYRESRNERPITYEVAINVDAFGRPFVESEVLKQRRQGQDYGRPYPFLRLSQGKGHVWAGDSAVEAEGEEDTSKLSVELTDTKQLGIATLGTLKEHPRIKLFRDFLKGWYLSYFYPDAARTIPVSGPQKHLNIRGDNIANVVQYMKTEHPKRFDDILARIASRIPGITSIQFEVTKDKRILLGFNGGDFSDPFLAPQMSDGTLKMLAYLLLLEDPDPAPFICIEEPENGLYHKLLDSLAREFLQQATGRKKSPQIFVTTHQPYFVDGLAPENVWILEKGPDGFSTIRRVAEIEVVKNLVIEGLTLGSLWYSEYLDRT